MLPHTLHRSRRRHVLALTLILALPTSGCLRNLGAWFEEDGPSTPSLESGHYIFEVSHELDREAAGTLERTLTWEDYRLVEERWSYPVEFSAEGRELTIWDWDGELAYRAELVELVNHRWHYRLVEGAFAGGHFLLWVEDGGLKAELTLYGSGLPVIASERGILLPDAAP